MAHTTMSGRDARELAVTRFFQMCNTHCPANVAPLMTADVQFLADQEANGEQAVSAYLVWLWQSYPEISFRVESAIVDENRVAAEVSYEHGPHGRGERCFVFQFRGDKIRRIRCY